MLIFLLNHFQLNYLTISEFISFLVFSLFSIRPLYLSVSGKATSGYPQPLWLYALILNPGAYLYTRHNLHRSAAFRHSAKRRLSSRYAKLIHAATTIHFSGLNTEPVTLIPSGFGLLYRTNLLRLDHALYPVTWG